MINWQDTPCNEWTGATNSRGYGKKTIWYESKAVHRLEWEKHNGPIPAGKSILHHCDNPPCYEIAHLFMGNQSDNMKDMYKKNRRTQNGENNNRSKLTVEQVARIKELLKLGEQSIVAIAREFKVHRNTVSAIKFERNWKNVG